MIRPKSFCQLAAYGISLPVFAASPKLAKETVYMPSRIAEQTLGQGAKLQAGIAEAASAPVKRET